ncbi:efflux RND transporter periplasmic adaptor subunit [Xanthomonas euvesicatoria]|uniref:efflux RND transporter periplasmic adaptor subunit n=1 Tax=Xanthomonas euvesicatoria TaxID=456327 RepID=UPI001C44B92B|nr:efflux RND transporter periplasmic adaptor subunit [Xanthomonas euvesicatoria]MBV6885458.1 efflux RND transporter periplasmic adaptor subunit [Xanthomonas campestris pv. euphorbiae]
MNATMSRIVASGLVGGCLLALSGCKPSSTEAATAQAPEVDVAPVVHKEVVQRRLYNGQVAAINAVEIQARVTGHVVKVTFQEGGVVAKGDLLFVIDQRPYQIAVQNARAQLDRAVIAQTLARHQDQRAKVLIADHAISREAAEERASSYGQASAEVNAALAALKTAQLNLQFTEVRSPVVGRTSRAEVTLGNMVVADQTVLTSVVSQDPVYVYFNLDEKDFIRMKSTLQPRESPSGNELRIGRAGEQDVPYVGKVDLVDNRVDSSTGTIQVRAVVPNASDLLTPGMFANVQLGIPTKGPVVLITERAILTDQNKKYVYVVGKDKKASRRDVQVGDLSDDGLRIIERGLTGADQVVVAGLHKIYASDTKVRPRMVFMIKPAKVMAAHSTPRK